MYSAVNYSKLIFYPENELSYSAMVIAKENMQLSNYEGHIKR